MNPLLLEFPDHFETERLLIRAPRPGDGAEVHAAIQESLSELKPWMPWLNPQQTVDDTEANVRQAAARFTTREDLRLQLFLKGTSTLVGASGLHRIDWAVPKFEIGYWGRTPLCGRGYMTEAVKAIATFAEQTLGAKRIEIRMDDRNERSWRVAERAGFPLEAVLKNERRALDGSLADGRIYAKTF